MAARDGEPSKTTEPRTRKQQGHHAEGVAARYLESHGITIVDRNVHSRGGELDLIGLDGDTVVFFEVRYRRAGGLTDGAGSIGWRKQQRLIRAASVYLHKHRLWNRNSRIDVVAIAPGQTSQYRIQWIRNAIQAEP